MIQCDDHFHFKVYLQSICFVVFISKSILLICITLDRINKSYFLSSDIHTYVCTYVSVLLSIKKMHAKLCMIFLFTIKQLLSEFYSYCFQDLRIFMLSFLNDISTYIFELFPTFLCVKYLLINYLYNSSTLL